MKHFILITLMAGTGVIDLTAQTSAFTYQGRLNSSNGPANGTYDFVFRLYDAPTGGTQFPGLPNPRPGVSVSNGLFTVTLDFTAAVLDGAPRWLQIEVATNGVPPQALAPRQQLMSAPYAFFAARAGGVTNGAITTSMLANSAVTGFALDNDAVSSAKVLNGSLTAADLNLSTFATTFWKTDGNAGTTPGTHFLGTTDNTALELKVNGMRALRLVPTATNGAVNVIGGSSVNVVGGGAVGATIGGGGAVNYGGQSFVNRVAGDFGTVGGGQANRAESDRATVGGGSNNAATNDQATVSGGGYNIAGGASATVAGGFQNSALGVDSTVGGGFNNESSASFAFVGGGANNMAAASYATVGGGDANTASSGAYSTVGGGRQNLVQGSYSTIGGGRGNKTLIEFNTVGGGESNYCAFAYGTIAGGQKNTNSGYQGTIGGGYFNLAEGDYSTIGGGRDHIAVFDYGTIGGGSGNIAGGNATVGGGRDNVAYGLYSTVPGGIDNLADEPYSFAAGRRAKADDEGSFVWADSSDFDFHSAFPDQFAVRCVGGAKFVTAIDGSGAQTAGVRIQSGENAWSSISDRNAKKDFLPVNGQAVLEKLAAMPVQSWHYKWEAETNTPHIGPMAQDFKAAFYPGRDDKSISTLEFDGVALAAIQGLNQKLEAAVTEKQTRIEALEKTVAELKELVTRLAEKD
jgi:trimeric autotransporter adhesin